MTAIALTLELLPGAFAICRLPPDTAVPEWTNGSLTPGFVSITRTPDELSIVCPEAHVPPGITNSTDWRALRVAGTLDFALTGILAAIAAPLATAGVSIFALSTYDTDYLLIPQRQLAEATAALEQAGHQVVDKTESSER